MNKLHLGFYKEIDLPSGKMLLIDDEVPDPSGPKREAVFDPRIHSFNPLKNIDYRAARELAVVLYAINPQGENTLTVRNGKRALLPALLSAHRLDKVSGDEEVEELIADLLFSPILKRVLCNPKDQFPFTTTPRIFARINRAELGEFDALVLALFLIAHYKEQLVIPDFGFYGRDPHANLIRQNRLVAGVNYLDELPLQLRKSVLSIPDKRACLALYEDAVMLARLQGLVPGQQGFTDEVATAMERR